MSEDIGGVWRTIAGRRVFIKDGQDLSTAMRESGKFKTAKVKKSNEKIKKEIDDLNTIQNDGFDYGEDNDNNFTLDDNIDKIVDEIEKQKRETISQLNPDDEDYENDVEYYTASYDDDIKDLKDKYDAWQDKQKEKIFNIEKDINSTLPEDEQVDLIENFTHNGTAYKEYLEAYYNDDKETLQRMTSALQKSKFRHTKTDYDKISKKYMTQEEVEQLRRDKS